MSDQSRNPISTCKTGKPFTFPPAYSPAQFLYGNQGPWPSAPDESKPCSVAPEVIAPPDVNELEYCFSENASPYIPCDEMCDWFKNLQLYYDTNAPDFVSNAIDYCATTLGKLPPGELKKVLLSAVVIKAMFEGYPDDKTWKGEFDEAFALLSDSSEGPYPALDDALFTNLIAHGLFSKLLCRPDKPDYDLFKGFQWDDTREYWKNDATHMRVVQTPNEGEYLAPAIVLLSRPKSPIDNYDFRVEAIALFGQAEGPGKTYNQQADIFSPADGNAWQLAKYFALQGVLVRINLIDHPMVHFPSDAINAITKTALPKSNLVLQLLLPHFRLSLPVNDAVLDGKHSLLSRTGSYPYGPYPAKGDEIRKVFPFYWAGSDSYAGTDAFWNGRKNAFPAYQFALEPRQIPSRYVDFLNAYHAPILTFTKKVVQCIPLAIVTGRDWADICAWADYVASWIPGFPDNKAINDPDTLAKALAMIIWNAAIVHSADHYLMHDLFEKKYPTPYVIRNEPPKSKEAGSDNRAMAEVADVFAARFCDLLFFMPHNTSLLIDSEYGFDKNNTDLMQAVKEFKDDLIKTAKDLKIKYPEFQIMLDSTAPKDIDHKCFGAGVQY
jgi:hypothetical protein